MELKNYINKILGDNIRCILPSYWWKRIFGLVIDSVENEVGAVKKSLDTKATKSEVNSINTKIETLESNITKSCRFFVPVILEGNQITTLTAEQVAENKDSYSLIKYSTKLEDYDFHLYLSKNYYTIPLGIRSIAMVGDVVEITSNFLETDTQAEHFNYIWKHTISSDGQVNSELMEGGGMPLYTATSAHVILPPNKYCRMISSAFNVIVVELGAPTGNGIMDNYMFEFTTPANFQSITWPEGLKWQNGEDPLIEDRTTYQVSIVNNLAIISAFL